MGKHALAILLRASPAEDVDLELFEIEDREQLVENALRHDCLA